MSKTWVKDELLLYYRSAQDPIVAVLKQILFFFQLLEIRINFILTRRIIYCHKSTYAPVVSQHFLLQQSIGWACRNPTRRNFEVSIQRICLSVGKFLTVTTCLETSSSLREIRSEDHAKCKFLMIILKLR